MVKPPLTVKQKLGSRGFEIFNLKIISLVFFFDFLSVFSNIVILFSIQKVVETRKILKNVLNILAIVAVVGIKRLILNLVAKDDLCIGLHLYSRERESRKVVTAGYQFMKA